MAVISEHTSKSLNNVLSQAGLSARTFKPTEDGVVASVYFCIPENASQPKEVLKIFEEPAESTRNKGLEEAAALSQQILELVKDKKTPRLSYNTCGKVIRTNF